jgi:hypothetical protein
MRDSIVNARKLDCIVVEVSTCHFRAVPAQAWPKMRAGPFSPPCRDPERGTAQNISCHAVFRVMPKDRAMTRPQLARPKSQL